MRTILADEIQTRLNDPRIPPITSITRIEVSADFSNARVYVSVFPAGDQDEQRRASERKLCLEALQSAAGHLRWVLGRELTLRKTPALEFLLDESLQCGFETVQTIDRAMRELGEVPEWEREQDAETPEEGLESPRTQSPADERSAGASPRGGAEEDA